MRRLGILLLTVALALPLSRASALPAGVDEVPITQRAIAAMTLEHAPSETTHRQATYTGPHEPPDDEFPFRFTTGRSVYHFHTRTKTGRTAELEAAAPSVWVELSAADASSLGIADGDVVEVRSRRGRIVAPVKVTGIDGAPARAILIDNVEHG